VLLCGVPINSKSGLVLAGVKAVHSAACPCLTSPEVLCTRAHPIIEKLCCRGTGGLQSVPSAQLDAGLCWRRSLAVWQLWVAFVERGYFICESVHSFLRWVRYGRQAARHQWLTLVIWPVLKHGPRSSNGTRVIGFNHPKAKWNANVLLFVVVPRLNDKLLMLSGICRLQAWCLRPERWWPMPS
jgi:hypothetical protein